MQRLIQITELKMIFFQVQLCGWVEGEQMSQERWQEEAEERREGRDQAQRGQSSAKGGEKGEETEQI